MHLKFSLVVLPLLIGLYVGWKSQLAPERYQLLTPSLVRELEELRQRWDVSGVAIGVVKLGVDKRFDSWKTDLVGLGTKDGDGNPVDENTLFSIASNTKLFAAINVGLAIANESTSPAPKLKWDTKLKDVFPEWKLMDPVASELTDVVDLLSHRTGVTRNDMAFPPRTSPYDMIRKLRHFRPSAEFRQTWHYNNIAYHIASVIPETLYGASFAQYTREHVLSKLRMNSTYFDEDSDVATRTGNRAQGFARRDQDVDACAEDEAGKGFSAACLGKKMNIGYFDPALEHAAGHWGIVSSIMDLVLLLQGRSPYNNETIIPESIIEMTSQSHSIPAENPLDRFPELGKSTYGLGQQMSTYREHRVAEHFGTIPGHVSWIMRMPELGAGVVVLVNDHELGMLFARVVTWRILDHLLGVKPIDWERRLKPLLTQGLRSGVPAPQGIPFIATEMPSADLQGIYHDPAYGNLVLCAAPLPTPIGIPPSSNLDAECREIMANHPFDAHQLVAPSTYVGNYEGNSTMYLRFSHIQDSTYSVSLGQVFPQTGEKLPATYNTWTAMMSSEGIAYSGNAWEMGLDVAVAVLDKDNLKGTAGVWFDRM